MRVSRIGLLAATLLIASAICAQPQQPTLDQFAGNYKGTTKMASGEADVTLEIKTSDGKVSGRAVSAKSEYQITSGELAGGKLALKLGTAPDVASLTLEQKGDVLTGEWIHGAQKGTVELKKFDPNAKDEISGEWDAVADSGYRRGSAGPQGAAGPVCASETSFQWQDYRQ